MTVASLLKLGGNAPPRQLLYEVIKKPGGALSFTGLWLHDDRTAR